MSLEIKQLLQFLLKQKKEFQQVYLLKIELQQLKLQQNLMSKKEIVSPGHVFPIVARDGGVLIRAGHTEASVDISKLANKNSISCNL